MTRELQKFLVIDIGSSVIKTYIFSSSDYVVEREIKINEALSPGTFTVMFTEVINLIQKDHLIHLIFVVIPGVIDDKGRCVTYIQEWPRWENVPLSDWLEVRVKRKVLLISKDSFTLLNDVRSRIKNLNNKKPQLFEQSV